MSQLVFSRLNGQKILNIKNRKFQGAPPISANAEIKKTLDSILLPSKIDSYEERWKSKIAKNRVSYKNRFKSNLSFNNNSQL